MTAKLFLALYAGLILGMIVLFVANFMVAWVLFVFVFVAVFGGLMVIDHPRLIATGFLLVSLLVMALAVYGMRQSLQVNEWPAVTGAVTHSSMCVRNVNGQVVYRGPCIDYTYTANGNDYKVSSIDTGEFSDRTLFWGIGGIPPQYRVDQAVKVYYDPANPGVSRLDPSISPRDWITASVGGIMAVLAAFTLWWLTFMARPNDVPLASLLGLQSSNAATRQIDRGPRTDWSPDIENLITKLAQLHDRGALTDEEYELAKKKLLDT